MEQNGVVKRINGDIAEIAFIKKSGCGGNCGSCKSPCPSDTIIIPVQNTLDANVGDAITVSVNNKAFSSMTFWAYVFPTIMTLIGLFGGVFTFKALNISNYELFGAIIGLVFLVVSFLLSSKLNKKSKDGSYDFKMIKKN
ncbi:MULTISPECIES: SoxR reducing system RseC family protein [Clostridium]|uniref:SoxR reducing system RseC family protein n=1 Tax=Clostridium senegalense TaxID=1465809 RepID=A0A6M0H8I8_9CLOT|nr:MULTISPECIES: SoxR reducing system RseC family protein [Clostridium]NEU06171.1 SoxR reducing system RseC family protein [Clostridium senegalense]